MLCPTCKSDLGPTTEMPTEKIYCAKCKIWVPTNTKAPTASVAKVAESKELVFTPKVSEYTDPISTDL